MKGYETIEEGKREEEPYLTISDFPLQRWCMLFAELTVGSY